MVRRSMEQDSGSIWVVSVLRSYRSTSHSTTGVAPSVLLYGENRTNRLPAVVEEREAVDDKQVRERDGKRKETNNWPQEVNWYSRACNLQEDRIAVAKSRNGTPIWARRIKVRGRCRDATHATPRVRELSLKMSEIRNRGAGQSGKAYCLLISFIII